MCSCLVGTTVITSSVPLTGPQYSAYQSARGALALPQAQLLGITDPSLGAFGLHYALPELQALFNRGKLAILANVGVLVQPTAYQDLADPSFSLPTNLRSHADQIVLMQTGYPNASGSSGWGGRTLDQLQTYNANTSFPIAIAMNSPAIYCVGSLTQGVSLQPGNALVQDAFGIYPPAAAQARATAQQQIVTASSGNALIDAANKVMASALTLSPLLQSAAGSTVFPQPFPATEIGDQLQEIAHIISLNSQLSVGRQVFFCSLGGFDTHGGQAYQQWDLLQQVSKALDAFFAAMSAWGIENQVTAFTLSDFGRTLQPSGAGSDHGWGNHHVILGGAVLGGKIYGRFPVMTNYNNFNASADDYADNRGVMLPSTSLVQYGATLAKWFGATDAQLNGIFPQLANFAARDVGFMA
ncbi:MAG: DUF1501 domain-containing protein [Deltaproteobacteria bacterium]|nr:DUF1501 domain-containing protein [Deltaproteobacteria bacterium]